MKSLPTWRNETFIFYISVFITAFIISIIFDKKIFKSNKVRIKLNVSIPFFILLIIKGFAECGTDLITNYKYNFDAAINLDTFRDQSTEFGYRLVTVLIRNLTTNYNVYLFILTLMTLIPIYKLINKYKNSINIPIVILAYTTIFFLPGISLIRIYLSASICLFSFDALINRKYYWCIIWIFIASSFHVTALLMMLPCIAIIFKVNKKLFSFSLLSALLVIYLGRNQIGSLMNGRYSIYNISSNFEIGTQFIWYYMPMVIVYIYIYFFRKKYIISNNFNSKILDYSFMWVLLGMFIGILQYIIPIFGRLYAFTIPIIFFWGSALEFIRINNKRKYWKVYIFAIVYFSFRVYIYLYEYHFLDGIMPYKNCFDLII